LVIDLNKVPKTRYQGSKRKILPWIHQNLKELDFETVLDGFGGSGMVSYLFKLMNKEVHYNDKLSFNYYIGKAIIENDDILLSQDDIDHVLNPIYDPESFSFVQKNFNEVFYLSNENEFIDNMVSNLMSLKNLDSRALDYKKSLAYYALFQACLIKRPFNLFHRKNLGIRTADVKRSFGNKTAWDKPFEFYIKKFSQEANDSIFDTGKSCLALNQSIFNIDSYGYDLIYLDPPYMKKNDRNESSDYLKCYHFLEGIANYNHWTELVDYNSPYLKFKKGEIENDFTSKNISSQLERIISNFRNSKIVISYKVGGVPSIDDLQEIVKKFKKNVFTVSLHYKYALNKQNGNADLNREVLIIGI
jgi:adenine-specific DNA-methyltransferase